MSNFFGKNLIATDDPFRIPLPDTGRTFDEFINNDAAIKIWLPEPVEQRLEELSNYFSESRTRLLRSIYFVYLYGRYDYEQMRQKSLGFFHIDTCEVPLFSRHAEPITHRSGPATTPQLGKNNADIKLFLPKKMRDDLQQIANKVQTPLSQLLREVLVSTLFGHSYLPARIQSQEPDVRESGSD